jgi:hypothetical protein
MMVQHKEKYTVWHMAHIAGLSHKAAAKPTKIQYYSIIMRR